MERKYVQTTNLQNEINWGELMKMPRYAGGHDDQMRGLFKRIKVMGHWNEGDCQGMVATCVKFIRGDFKGKYAIYNDYYGSCSGCDSWEDADDGQIRSMCISLSNSAYVFDSIEDVKEFLSSIPNTEEWSSYSGCATGLLDAIVNGKIKNKWED